MQEHRRLGCRRVALWCVFFLAGIGIAAIAGLFLYALLFQVRM